MQSNLAMRYIARSFTTFRKDGTLPLIHDINPFSELQYQHQQQHQPKPLPQFKQVSII